MGTAGDWDADEEKAREKRIGERRERVHERLRAQQQQRAKQGEGSSATDQLTPASGAPKGKQQAAASAEAVKALLARHRAEAEATKEGAEQRCEAHHAACDAEEAELREQVAEEAEASRRENRAIDLEWEQLQSITNPQELAGRIAEVSARCGRVLESKEGMLSALRALLARRDEQFVRLLREQAEETDALIAAMHGRHGALRQAQEHELEAVETAYLQERTELLAAQKAELDALLEKRSTAEAEFMEQYLAACEQYENELERLRVEGLSEHGSLKRKLETDVASLEAHLDGIKAAYMLNADKLDYNYRVLVERERESKEALMQQKRKITRQWEVLNRLRKRHDAAEARAAAENARLTDEYQHVTRAFNHLQTKFRHFKAADLARFEQVRGMKEEELGELVEQLVEAEAFISSYVVGLPPTAGPLAAAAAGTGRVGSGAVSLELVGQAVAVDPRAAAAAAAAAGLGPSEGLPAEVVALSSAEVCERSQLIPAYHPSSPAASDVSPVPADRHGLGNAGSAAGLVPFGSEVSTGALLLDAVAEQELRASADVGAISLLFNADARQLRSKQLRELLSQVVAAGTNGGLTADAVARALGLQRGSTVEALERAFLSSARLADTIRPRVGGGEPSEQGTADGQVGGAGSTATFTFEQVEAGLACLLQQVLAPAATPTVVGSAASSVPSSAPATVPAAPTSKQYWQGRADAVVPSSVVRAWTLLEAQAGKRFATLQGRTGLAEEVLGLRHENEALKATLAELLHSPLNRELQLPPTLLLR